MILLSYPSNELLLSALQILWENRKINDIGNDCLSSVDGVDCSRTWPSYYNHKGKLKKDKRYYTHKFKAGGLRYEVALSIRSSDIVWIAGPYLPGIWNDLAIFRLGLMYMLEDGERIEADDGYKGECPQYVKCPRGVTRRKDKKKMKARVRMRHETINERLKNYTCLEKLFRHSDEKHALCFRACAVLVQLAMEGGEELFDCREYDDTMTDQQVEELFGL